MNDVVSRKIISALDLYAQDRQKELIALEKEVAREKELHLEIEHRLSRGLHPPQIADESRIEISSPPPLIEFLNNNSFAEAIESAEKVLKQHGIDSEAIPSGIPYHQLTKMDMAFAFGCGIAAAIAPNIRVHCSEDQTSSLTSWIHENQNGEIKKLVEDIFGGGKSEVIDSVTGRFHRFVQDSGGNLQHDPFFQIASALGGPINLVIPGIRKAASHLLVDACGDTGIPLPGSHYLLNFLDFLELNQFDSQELSKFLSLRHTDAVATGLTSSFLFLYDWIGKVPSDSLRRCKMGIIAHGVCSVSIFALASFTPHLAARRSHLNYISASLFLKNCYLLKNGSTKLEEQGEAWAAKTKNITQDLLQIYRI